MDYLKFDDNRFINMSYLDILETQDGYTQNLILAAIAFGYKFKLLDDVPYYSRDAINFVFFECNSNEKLIELFLDDIKNDDKRQNIYPTPLGFTVGNIIKHDDLGHIKKLKQYMLDQINDISHPPLYRYELELRLLATYDDYDTAHSRADNILCELLEKLGYSSIVDAYNKVGKWYA